MKKKLNNIHIFVLLFAFGSLSFMGCEKTESPQPQIKPKTKAVTKSVPVQHQMSTEKSVPVSGGPADFSSLKDPFKPLIADTKKAPVARKNRFGQVLPILNFEVTQFKVSGIIVGLRENSALLLDPTGKPYVVKTGMEIGRNEGRITKIGPDYIDVFEKYRDENGKVVKKTIRLTLPKKQ
jgi:type IV pilus assembly protein PilP